MMNMKSSSFSHTGMNVQRIAPIKIGAGMCQKNLITKAYTKFHKAFIVLLCAVIVYLVVKKAETIKV